ncbi:MAG: ABC transporter substrate-binding protein [Lentisphaeria bacterium]|nr:hypothetical protein [Lentisphaerota bacterium]MBR7143994.1 ABC transporter substrate-binding protein [Lentisphaeria bacterium]
MKNLLLFCLLILFFTGCDKPRMLQPPRAEKLRILSLVTCADHIIAELGSRDKIAAIDRHGKVLESMQGVPVTVAGGMVSREMLRKYNINHAIIWYYQCSLMDLFQKEGISVSVIEPLSVKNYAETVRTLGQLCNQSEAAEKLLNKFYAAIPEKSPDIAVLKPVYMELYTQWKSPAQAGYIAEILNYAGGRLAVAGKYNGTVSPEKAALAKPEVIFFVEGFGSAEELAIRTALRNTPAVKNKKIYAIPRKLVCEGVAPEELLKFLSDKIKEH